MVYSSNRPLETSTDVRINDHTSADFNDRVHWGPIIAGLVVALSSQLVLSALGAALGFSNIAGSEAPRTNSGGVAQAVGWWTIVSLFISLFIGGWITTRAFGSINRNTALLNGAILWATTLALSAWLLANGVSGAFGIAAANAGNIANQAQQSGLTLPSGNPNASASPNATGTPSPLPTLTAQQTREVADNGAKASWGFTLGSLLGLAAALIGATTGARNAHTYRATTHSNHSNEV